MLPLHLGPYTRGSLRFEGRREDAASRGPVAMFEVECPDGTVKTFAWPKTVSLEIEPGFMHRAERNRLVAGAREQGDHDFDMGALLGALAKGFTLEPLEIEEKKLHRPLWHDVVPCCTATVSYIVAGVVYIVTATTTAAVTIDGEDFPADDQVAWFKIWVPEAYHFQRRCKWDPGCCKDEPKTIPPLDRTEAHFKGDDRLDDLFPHEDLRKYDWKMNPYPPKPIVPPPPKEEQQKK